VRLLFCLRTAGGWEVSIEPFAERVTLPRVQREAALENWAARYAERLEMYARRMPFQWFNFFDFWQE
jgi:predicted LPLAT superfamily acyltransferase